jgi:hypothetical protein
MRGRAALKCVWEPRIQTQSRRETVECSPGRQSWVYVPNQISPVGTTEISVHVRVWVRTAGTASREIFSRPCGTESANDVLAPTLFRNRFSPAMKSAKKSIPSLA